MTLGPAKHPGEWIAVLAMEPWPPQRPLIAREHDVTLLAGVGEDLVVIRARPELGLEVNDSHDHPAALAQGVCEGPGDVFVQEQPKAAGHAAAQRPAGPLPLLFGQTGP